MNRPARGRSFLLVRQMAMLLSADGLIWLHTCGGRLTVVNLERQLPNQSICQNETNAASCPVSRVSSPGYGRLGNAHSGSCLHMTIIKMFNLSGKVAVVT